MVLSLRDSRMESNNKQSEDTTDFVDQLQSYETKNRRILKAREIQNFELAHNEYVMNYFMHHQQFNSIVEYETSFLQLKRWAETWSEESFDEDWVVSQFVAGLKEEIRNYVNLWRPDSLQRAIVLAKWQELCLVDKVFEKIPEPTKAKDNSEIKKEFVYHEEIEREQSMKVNSIGPFSLISSGHVFVFAPFISSSLINDCGCQDFEKYLEELRIPGSKLRENGLYWGERGKIESTEFYFSKFLKPFLLYYDGCTMLVGCNFWCLGDVNELGLQEFCLKGEKYMEVVHKSLGLLTQNFIILFLWSNVEIIFLGEAAMRTKVRRLYVIVNELQFSVFKFYIEQSDGIIEVFEDISQQEAQILWQTSKYFMAILKAKDKVKHENYLVFKDNKAGFHICFRRELITKELEYHDVMSGKTARSESLGFNCDPGEIIVLKGNRECKGTVKFHLGDKVVVDGPGNACHALVKGKMGIGVAEQCSSWDNVPLLYKSIWTIQNGKFAKSSLLCTKIAPAPGILVK